MEQTKQRSIPIVRLNKGTAYWDGLVWNFSKKEFTTIESFPTKRAAIRLKESMQPAWVPLDPPESTARARRSIKPSGPGGSVHTVSGGLPTINKRRR